MAYMRLGQQQRRQLAELGRGCEAVHVGVEVHQRAHRQAEARRDPARRLVLLRQVPSADPRLLRLLLLLPHVLDLHLLGARRAHRCQRPGPLLEDGLHGVAQRKRVRPLALPLRVIGSRVVVAAVAARHRGGHHHRHLGLSALATADLPHHQLPSRAGSAHHDAPLGAVATLANGPNGKVRSLGRGRLAICSREWRRLRDGSRTLGALLVRRHCRAAPLRAGGLRAAVHGRGR